MGDSTGRVYFFSTQGDVLTEHDTGAKSAVSAVGVLPLLRNVTLLAARAPAPERWRWAAGATQGRRALAGRRRL